ncbi:hypothetical protein HMPREF3192_00988 [Atopobium deltae]|uniref:Uncharacterized protein n=1 Tax=Atopobium deltae TaxID=1393034 RepID=A0A133XS48_9ACTN|nr:hypothetical protein HMPREF3192_00988 [Atopobium deltae]
MLETQSIQALEQALTIATLRLKIKATKDEVNNLKQRLARRA